MLPQDEMIHKEGQSWEKMEIHGEYLWSAQSQGFIPRLEMTRVRAVTRKSRAIVVP